MQNDIHIDAIIIPVGRSPEYFTNATVCCETHRLLIDSSIVEFIKRLRRIV